jgi:hypothetical protein
MADVVFVLCALTSLGCAVLLLRGYRKGRARLLLWSGLCFAFLFVNNVMMFLDMRIFRDVDLSLWRSLPGLFGIGLLVFGLIWDVR